MNTRDIWIFIAIVIVLLLGAWYFLANRQGSPAAVPVQPMSEQDQVRNVVLDFGTRLQTVSLTASKENAAAAIAANYAADVSPALLASWEADPSTAPGRLTSSPWPDHINIQSVTKNQDGTYTVTGEVAEKTSVEEANGGVSDTYPITLMVRNVNGAWLITDVKTGLIQTDGNGNPTTELDKG